MSIIQDAQRIYRAAVEAVQCKTLVQKIFKFNEDSLEISRKDGTKTKISYDNFENVYVFAIGKSAPEIAREFEQGLGAHLKFGVCISPGYSMLKFKKILCMEGDHPYPGSKTIASSKVFLEQLKKVGSKDLVFFIVTGGGSSCFEVLPSGISIDDLKRTHELLLSKPIPIEEMNQIRAAISEVKGGKTFQHVQAGFWINIVLSDVASGEIHRVASGPTISHPYFGLKMAEKYDLLQSLPSSIVSHLEKYGDTEEAEEPPFGVATLVLGGIEQVILAAQLKAEQLGYSVKSRVKLTGLAQDAGRKFLDSTFSLKSKQCVLGGGETVVDLTQSKGLIGKGGRNCEFVLAALIRAQEQTGWPKNWIVFSAGTDGKDGNSGVAGAFITGDYIDRMLSLEVDPRASLASHDSASFFKKLGSLMSSGPTGTNVLDLAIGLVQ